MLYFVKANHWQPVTLSTSGNVKMCHLHFYFKATPDKYLSRSKTGTWVYEVRSFATKINDQHLQSITTCINHNIKRTCLTCTSSSATTLTCWAIDSTRPLKVSSGFWHQHISSMSFNPCKLGGDPSMDWRTVASLPQVNDAHIPDCPGDVKEHSSDADTSTTVTLRGPHKAPNASGCDALLTHFSVLTPVDHEQHQSATALL